MGPTLRYVFLGLNIKTILRKKMAGSWVRWAGRGKKNLNLWRGFTRKNRERSWRGRGATGRSIETTVIDHRSEGKLKIDNLQIFYNCKMNWIIVMKTIDYHYS